MRIYYKKKFWAGVGALLLGLALPGTCLFVGWERFDLKDAVLTMFMVLSGISGILRSLDREKARQDRDEDRDDGDDRDDDDDDWDGDDDDDGDDDGERDDDD